MVALAFREEVGDELAPAGTSPEEADDGSAETDEGSAETDDGSTETDDGAAIASGAAGDAPAEASLARGLGPAESAVPHTSGTRSCGVMSSRQPSAEPRIRAVQGWRARAE